jgi:hypothetical protein
MKLFILIFFILTTTVLHAGTRRDSTKYYNLIKQDVIGAHEDYETPYYILVGKKLNPVMILDGGIHGDEIAAYMACDTIIKYINILEGTLIIIPKLNIQACNKDTREVNMDFNHAFPGNISSDVYEFRLAYEFMWLVDSVKPDIIINLHEAHTKYENGAQFDSEKAYGQIVISCIQPFEKMLTDGVEHMNQKIPADDFKFHPHYYSFREYSSLDNFVSKFQITSYTVETYRGFNIEDRVKLQVIASLQFMEEAGLKIEYPEVKF